MATFLPEIFQMDYETYNLSGKIIKMFKVYNLSRGVCGHHKPAFIFFHMCRSKEEGFRRIILVI